MEVRLYAADAPALDAKAEQVRAVVGAQTRQWVLRDAPRPAPASPPLQPLDVRMLARLIADARQPIGDLAAGLGLTPRTAQRHADALRASGFARLGMGGNLQALGYSFAYVGVTFRSQEAGALAMEPLKRMLPDVLMRFQSPTHHRFLLWTRRMEQVRDLAERVRAIPGAGPVRLHFVLDYLRNPEFPDAFGRLLDEARREPSGEPAAEDGVALRP